MARTSSIRGNMSSARVHWAVSAASAIRTVYGVPWICFATTRRVLPITLTAGTDRQTYFSYDGGATLSLAATLSFNNEKGTPPKNGDTADFTQQDVFGAGNPGETDTLSQTDLEMMDVLGWDPTAEDFWTGGSGSWTSDFVTPWSTGSAPIASQDAWINELNPNLTLSVVASKGNVTVNSIQITNHSSLEIENDSTFAATNGTQLNSDDGGLTAPGNTGSIFVDDGSTLQAGGTFDNPAGILLQSTGDATNFEVEADGVTLTGGGDPTCRQMRRIPLPALQTCSPRRR